jgi:hypothetical protein
MQICPVNREWIHNYLLEPYLQGCELVNRAWIGVDRCLEPNHLSFKERIVCWLQGASLLIPFINTIIWLAWQAIGNPEKLFDPFCPEIDPPQQQIEPFVNGAQPPALIVPIATPVGGDRVKPIELFGYTEKVGDSEFETTWKIEHFQDVIVVQQDASIFSSTSLYRPDQTLRQYSYVMGPKQCDIWQDDEDRKHVHLRFADQGIETIERTFEIPDNLPLIQQRAFGLRAFIQSSENDIYFYSLIPEIPITKYIPFLAKPPFLMKTHAKKIGEEEIPDHGKLLKIEVMSAWGFPYNSVKSEMWFEVATGKLIKFLDTGMFIHRKEGKIRNSP